MSAVQEPGYLDKIYLDSIHLHFIYLDNIHLDFIFIGLNMTSVTHTLVYPCRHIVLVLTINILLLWKRTAWRQHNNAMQYKQQTNPDAITILHCNIELFCFYLILLIGIVKNVM